MKRQLEAKTFLTFHQSYRQVGLPYSSAPTTSTEKRFFIYLETLDHQ